MQTSTVVGRGGVVIGITCGNVWRVWEKDAEKQQSDLFIFFYYCSLIPNVLSWEDPNLRARLIPPALVHREIICIDHSIVFHQSGSHWERWGPIKNHFTLSEQS